MNVQKSFLLFIFSINVSWIVWEEMIRPFFYFLVRVLRSPLLSCAKKFALIFSRNPLYCTLTRKGIFSARFMGNELPRDQVLKKRKFLKRGWNRGKMPHISLFVIGASHITVNKQHTVVEKLTKILFALERKRTISQTRIVILPY